MHLELGGYHVGDIEVASAFDVTAPKVGRDVAEAIFAVPNNTHVFAQPPRTGVTVQRGPTLDGIGKYVRDNAADSDAPVVDVAEALRRSGTQVLVSYLPVGVSGGHRVLRRGGDKGGLRVRELRAGVHRLRRQVEGEVRARRPADRG